MVNADGMNVRMEGNYCDLMEDLAQIVASYVRSGEFDEDDILMAIKDGIKEGMRLRGDV